MSTAFPTPDVIRDFERVSPEIVEKASTFASSILADVAGASGGQEVSLQYSYPFDMGKGSLTPNTGVTWLSKDMANYYFGTLDEEVARGVVDYTPGSVIVPHVGMNYFRSLNEKWSVVGFVKYSLLPDEITDSPIVEADTDGMFSMFVGFSRGF